MKKKTGIIALLVVLIATLVPSMSFAAPPLRVELNGERIWFPDGNPFMDESKRVQVPVRFVSEALGAKVGWNKKAKVVTISHNSKVIKLTIGSKEFQVDGQSQQMDTSASAKGTSTYVPLRFVSQALGAKVVWNQSINTVEITTGDYKPEPQTSEEKVTKRVSHGFTVFENTGSGLDFVIDDRYERLGKNFPVLVINFHFKENYKLQLKEAEEILLQRIDKKMVDNIMKHLSAKSSTNKELEDLTVENTDFYIEVIQSYTDPNTNFITIWSNK